jgi:spermidine synthase
LPLLFGVTILTSACLLFLVQPLVSKLILPWFGGSAAVWITCMLFFQASLLLGYLYAHALTRLFSLKRQAMIHAALLLLAIATLPILPNARWQPKPGDDPTWGVFAVLATCVGLPYTLLSASSPLLQSWYAAKKLGDLPYRYFALSNAGSLLALLAYPVAVEPFLAGHQQAWFWSIAFGGFAILCAATALVAARAKQVLAVETVVAMAGETASITTVFLWLALSACASVLLLSVTNLLTQNIAPMPLLWVVPLSVYLLTFILCFEGGHWYRRIVYIPLLLPALACLASASGELENGEIRLVVPILTLALFVCCMACHGELARLKPAASQLTTFYLCLSAGGALGGVLIALVAPRVFPAMDEYPIAFGCCAALLLFVFWRERHTWRKPQLGMGLWLTAAAASIVVTGYSADLLWKAMKVSHFAARNFYGALRVEEFVDDNKLPVRELNHGTITHGMQIMTETMRHAATTYYGRNSGVGLAWRTLESAGPMRAGVIGLGTGTIAAYGRGGDVIRFYDINPLVVQIARKEFTYLADSAAHIDISLGDARLSMQTEQPENFNLLVVDAFSGDAIPVHLLTEEACRLYWRHLKPDGVLAVHISNHYLDLAPIVAMDARKAGKQVWLVDTDDEDANEVYGASWVLVANNADFFQKPLFKGKIQAIKVPNGMRPWTDDFSNLWQVLRFSE